MSTAHQHTRDRSRQRSIDRYSESSPQHTDPNSTAAGRKRLFSNRQSRLSYNSDHGENDEPEAPAAVHSEKRHRSSDWPLPNPSPANSSASRAPLRTRKAPNSPSSRRPSSQKRPSKFVEGSMNDRVSQKPPTPYLGTDEELQQRYERDQQEYNRGRNSRPHTNTYHPNGSLSGETDVSRHSSIFRFGKSIAASFNPSNWKIWSKPQQTQVEDEETTQQRILKERQEKAERIYQELKQSGHFRDSTIQHQNCEGPGDRKLFGKHDSGVMFGENGRTSRMSTDSRASRTSREEKRMGRVFLEPPNFNGRQGESPASNAGSFVPSNPSNVSSPNKQSFHFKKPSLSNIKKTFSSESTPTNGRYSGEHQARRIPSRKDLQKQQKLVKRVSDLEGKLEAARRQLNEALGEPLPPQVPPKNGRPRFVPGAMPTLPSERLLSGYVESEAGFSDCEMNDEIGKAVSFDQARETAPASGMSPVKAAPSPAWAGKPLPNPGTLPQDRVIDSVEKGDDEGAKQEEKAPEFATTASEVSTKLSSNDSSYKAEEEEGEGEEAVTESDKEPKPKPRRAKPGATKKRKSTFESQADDDGIYKPNSDSGSDPQSPVKKVAPRKKAAIHTPSKLQKTMPAPNSPPKYLLPEPSAQTSTNILPPSQALVQQPPAKSIKTGLGTSPYSIARQQIPPRQNNQKGTKKAPSTVSNHSSRRQSRTKIHQQPGGRQSVSPPPSSSFTGLEYKKPSQTVNHIGNQIMDGGFPPLEDDEAPPMPKLPKAVRLPSGEVVSTNLPSQVGSATSRTSRGSKLTKTRKEVKKVEGGDVEEKQTKNEKMSKSQSKASFEWPDDVF